METIIFITSFFGNGKSRIPKVATEVKPRDVTDDFSKISKKPFAWLPKFGNFTKNEETMGRNTSISLGNHFESFIESTVSKGRFSNASEVIRAGLRLLEEEESKIIALKKAINNGIESGIAEDFDPKKHLESLKAKKKNG